MTITIRIDSIKAEGMIGVNESEHLAPQPYVMDFQGDLSYDGRDDISATAHYGHVKKDIVRSIKESKASLLERAADDVVIFLLKAYPFTRASLRIHKPQANPGTDTSVEVARGWTEAYVAFGANMGETQEAIKTALSALARNPMSRAFKSSTIATTKAYGVVNQPDFQNGVCVFETLMDVHELLRFTQALEKDAGRIRKEHWGPRTLDLDILFFGDEVIRERDLNVPHADWENRAFVVDPLFELAPDYVAPLEKRTVRTIRDQLKKSE